MTHKNIIVAHAENNVIGFKGKMPWEGKLPADMKHFREQTLGKAVLMGRTTHESIGKALPKRRNVVLTTQDNYEGAEGIEIAHSLDEAYELLSDEELFIIGGERVYDATINDVDKIYTTRIRTYVEGDRYFPEIDKSHFALVAIERHRADGENKFAYEFREYERK